MSLENLLVAQQLPQVIASLGAFCCTIFSFYFFRTVIDLFAVSSCSCRRIESLRPVLFPSVLTCLQWIAVAVCRAAHWNHGFSEALAEGYTVWTLVKCVQLTSLQRETQVAIALVGYTTVVMHIVGILPQMISIMDAFAFDLGELRISALSITKGGITFIVLLWVANSASKRFEEGIKGIGNLEPSLQELFSKLARVSLVTFSVIFTLSSMGLDLSAFAIFGGAIGVGIGFGLQKVVSNLICGIILLLDRSIKPGDVIALEQGKTYGVINKLGARCVSVRTRSGKEHLIPNEDFVTHRAENWSYSDSRIRLSLPMRVGLDVDVPLVMRLLIESAKSVDRVIDDPLPGARLRSFGESAIEFELRVWIEDPHNGVSKVKSDIYINIWRLFKENKIRIPHPQRDLHLIKNGDFDKAAVVGNVDERALRFHLENEKSGV